MQSAATPSFPYVLPTLYKKSGKSLQFWEIRVELGSAPIQFQNAASAPFAGVIITKYGQLGTDSPQIAQETIEHGKNTGRKNATTALEQAIFQAEAKWKLQKKNKGYVDTKEAAERGELDQLIEGGIWPMLAEKFRDYGDRVHYPAYVQPKFDGHRCIAIVKDGVCTLWSRKRRRVDSVPHINAAILRLCGGADAIFDGELYNHEYKHDFEKITSLVKQKKPAAGHEKVQYYIYDFPSAPFQYADRYRTLNRLFDLTGSLVEGVLVNVDTLVVEDEEDVTMAFDRFFSQGYEGAMLRTTQGAYLSHSTRRSRDLLKLKKFDDAEFAIEGVEEGTGKFKGLAVFVCRYTNGEEFRAPMNGPLEKLREYWLNADKLIGVLITVQYQGLTAARGVPRFPRALRFREDV